jgi:hypothetical protein
MKHLRPFATVRQTEYLAAVEEHGSLNKAAKALGVSPGTIGNSLKGLEARYETAAKSARAGYAPGHFDSGVAPGYAMGKVTVQRNKVGEVERTWERQSPAERDLMRQVEEWARVLGSGIQGLAPMVKGPKANAKDVLCIYPFGDPHYGAYAWWQDAGADFDLDIAERLTKGAVDRLVMSAPVGSTGLLLNLGDMFHADNQKNVTQSGHQLDVDGRWAKVQQVGLRSMIHCIQRMLEVHSKVIVKINKGNHDGHSSYALALMLSCFFHGNPRVEVDLSPAVCWYFQFGKVLLGSTHGDTIKGKDMGAVMAADKPKEWGETSFRYWFVGHVHHKDVKEYPGVIVEYVRTLAARDAWHQGQGYRAGRDMQLVVMHREQGEIERHRCDVGMLEEQEA